MYIHVGDDILVQSKDIVAIIDKESANSPFVQEFLDRHEKHILRLSKGPFKSIVVTEDKVYFSPLASGTLKKRSLKLAAQEF